MVVTGVIRPPPEIRAVADKTALFVAKNGRPIEKRILNSAKGKTPKFAFLHGTSPFHAYYEDRIRFYEQGGKDGDEEEKPAKETNARNNQSEYIVPKEEKKQEKAQKASALDPIGRSLLTERNKIAVARNAKAKEDDKSKSAGSPVELEPPPPLTLASVVAPNVAPVQLETIKLVAQFTAIDGKGGPFMKELAIREWSNPTFAFMQPRHGHFAYFSALVDGYRRILSSWTESSASEGLQASIDDYLEAAAYRAEYDRDQMERKQQEDSGDVSSVAPLDWHDFVVVETIDFPVEEVVQTALAPPPTRAAAADEAIDESDDEEKEAIRVVPSYQPKVVSTKSVVTHVSRTHVIDPLTGKSVRIDDMPEHMRIQLLDPKWAEERKKFLDKQKDSNLVGGDVIASNISRFTQARGDLFGASVEELSGQDDHSKKRLDAANKVIREQASQQPGPMLPPPAGAPANPSALDPAMQQQLPPPPPPPPPLGEYENHILPPTKKQRIGEGSPFGAPPPPPAIELPPPPPPGQEPQEPPVQADDSSPEEPARLMSEADFVASIGSSNVTLAIKIPMDEANAAWNFNGQVVELSANVMATIKSVKGDLRSRLGDMPVNKIQLKGEQGGFFKDVQTLAQLNIGPMANLEMKLKERGGRR